MTSRICSRTVHSHKLVATASEPATFHRPMPMLETHPLPRHLIPSLAISIFTLAAPALLHASTFQAGNITSNLGPKFFVDDASNGGSDTDFSHNSTLSFTRLFNGLLSPNQGPTRVSISGFGFATHTSATANDATGIAVTFTYLGADGAVGGGDDVVIGTATGGFTFVPSASNPAAEYYFAFPTPLTADLTITATRFRIQVTPTNANHTGFPDTVLKLKSGALTSEPSVTSAKLSVAGVASPLIAPGRVNLAKFQPVTATSVAGQRLAAYLTDGVVGNDNRWQGSSSTWQSAIIDFPFPVEVGSAQVFTGVDDALAVSTFYIQYFDGSTWVSIPGGTVGGNTNVERNPVFTNPVTASSFRILGEDSNLRIRELALYPPNGPGGFPLGTDLTLNLAYQRPATASANTAGNFALNAVDGRASSFMWQTSTAGTNTLDIDLRVSTKIGSAHLYSGSIGVSPLDSFTLKYWDGAAWLNIPGGTVTGNTTADLVVSFTPVTTSQVRLEFTNSGTTSIRELCVFPANTGNSGYPLGTNLINAGPIAEYETYNDAFYLINNTSANRRMSVSSDGQPKLDPTGLTFGQSQYQILLNLSNGTYRLRNRASGNCLSGAQLDKTPGLPVTDAPYSALPHQDWILNPLGGGDFRLINQWSGLAIDTQGGATAAGTPLVQNTINNSATQRWEFVYYALYPKKGIGGTSFAMATNPDWAYNWGRINSSPTPEDTSFHPMQWGDFSWDIGSAQGPIWQNYPDWRKRSDGVHLLGFNEPDRTDQSNMLLSTVVSRWPRLQELDQPLVSPAPGTSTWLTGFYTQADALGYRVDYTAVHTYPGPSSGSADNLIAFVDSAYTYNGKNRPVWLTEFSFVDWGGTGSWSEEDNYNCLAEFLWRAETNDKLRKYALFIFTESGEYPQPANSWQNFTPAPRSNSYDINGNLTAFGKLYAAWDNVASVQTDKPYMIHHRGLSKRMANAATTNTVPGGRTIRTDGAIVNWTLVSTGVSNRYYVVSSIDGRRLSYVAGAGNPNNDPALAAAGTTGVDVEWSLTHNQHGWYYLGHPHTSTLLKMISYDTSNTVTDYQLVANTVTDNSVQWRFIVAPPETTWTGASGTSWTTAGSWVSSAIPAIGQTATFNHLSTANLSTVLNQDFDILGLRVINPTGAVSIGGTHSLTIGAHGINLSAATQNLTLNTPVMLNAHQGWSVNTSRTLSLGGAVSGDFDITISGAGKLRTTAPNLLPNGAGNGDLIVNGTLDLNGTSQSINGLTGTGVIDNTAVGPVTLTLGNNNAASSSCVFQDTGGSLTLIKTGTASLTLAYASTHSGGLTNSGSGNIVPQNNAAFGSGSVVMNGGTIYAASADYTIGNTLALNGANLRVGGGNNRTLTWSGPITATGNSGLIADGGTTGVTISGSLDISGATFSSNSGGIAHTISGVITGTGGTVTVTAGTLNLNGSNTFSGSFRSSQGILVIGNALAMQNATLDMNSADAGTLNLNNLSATLGALTGSRNLALGNGTVSIGNNSSNTTYSGVMSGNGSLVKTGNGTLTLAGANNYAGTTTVNAGTLALGANNALPATAVVLGNATLDAATFTDTAGTLNVTNTATINLGTGAALAFANSSSASWSGGTLNITGTFVSGASIRFGTSAAGLTSTQLGLITVNGGTGSFTLNSDGFLSAPVTDPYDVWKTQITNGQNGRTQDADGDGFNNLQEFLFGTSPIAGNGSLVTTTPGSGNFVLRWLQRETAATYALKQSLTLAAGSWTNVASPIPAADPDQSGTPADYDRYTVTLPTSGGAWFFRIQGVENFTGQGRDRFAYGHAECASRRSCAAISGYCIPGGP